MKWLVLIAIPVCSLLAVNAHNCGRNIDCAVFAIVCGVTIATVGGKMED